MELILVRHAPAESRDPLRWPDDSKRPLTNDGRDVAAAVGAGLRSLNIRPAQAATSPALRCRDTARITLEVLAPELSVEPWEELTYSVGPERLLAKLAESSTSDAGPCLLFGHEPSLGRLATLLLFGEPISTIRLKRGGAAAIETPRRPKPGSGRLQWIVTRRQLVALGARSR
jgi:phosphohistidine phosphatase